MELYAPSIEGTWQRINGKTVFVYTNADFLGLQVLGENVEPCFEGAAFYTLKDRLEELLEKMDNYEMHLKDAEGGNSEMPELNFKLSDSEKHNALWTLLNPNFSEENGWVIECDVCDVYDDYALVYNYESGNFERAYYVKNEDNIEITSRVTAYIVDVSENEMRALDAIRGLNGGSFENADAIYTTVDSLKEANAALESEKSEFEQKNIESEQSLSTLKMEFEELTNSFNELTESANSMTEELNELKTYKLNIETAEKEAVISKYKEKVSEEVISKYTEAIADYALEDLEKELAFEMVKNNPDVFSKNTAEKPQFVPKDVNLSGVERILSKYKK